LLWQPRRRRRRRRCRRCRRCRRPRALIVRLHNCQSFLFLREQSRLKLSSTG
jgi:hypothetical protein